MEQYYQYDLGEYKFVELITSLFQYDLQDLHMSKDINYGFFDKPGKDSDTIFHQIFYDRMRQDWPEFTDDYKKFIKEKIAPTVGAKSSLIYQKWPSFRVHLPGNVAVGGWHRDFDYHHPEGETNFIVAITPMFESNTTISESEPGKMDFRQFTLKPGEFVKFNGNKCLHGNLPNLTGRTRVSFDFRVMLPEHYDENHKLISMTKRNKFLIGDYYEIMKI